MVGLDLRAKELALFTQGEHVLRHRFVLLCLLFLIQQAFLFKEEKFVYLRQFLEKLVLKILHQAHLLKDMVHGLVRCLRNLVGHVDDVGVRVHVSDAHVPPLIPEDLVNNVCPAEKIY